MHLSSIVQWIKKHRYILSCFAMILCATSMCFAQNPTEKQIQDTIRRNVFDPSVDKHNDFINPEYKGGDIALMTFLQENLQYPTKALRKGVEGTIIVSFIVNTEGALEDIKIFRGIDPDCDKEAIRVISKLRKWEPGIVDGKKMPMEYKLPISFRLKK